MKEELELILHLAGDFYRPFPCPNSFESFEALKLANKNKLGLYFASRLLSSNLPISQTARREANSIRKFGVEFASKFKRSYSKLKDTLGEEFLTIKTYKDYPSTPGDIDILVRQPRDAVKRLQKSGYHVIREEEYKYTAQRNGSLPVSVHSRIAWGKVTVLDEFFLWNSYRVATMYETHMRIPAPAGELAIMLAHIPFEQLKITLADFFTICALAAKSDLEEVVQQAKEHRWSRTMQSVAHIVDALHRGLYGCVSPFGNILKLNGDAKAITPQFPYVLSLRRVIEAHLEKRAWSKIPQIRWYIVTRFAGG